MEFSIKSGHPPKASCDCIVVGVFDSRQLSAPAQELDKAAGRRLDGILRRGDMEGKSGSTLLVHGTPGIAAERVLLVGLGKAPVFAIFIALIACRMGLTVTRDARSVGANTTSTVVQSLVAIILLNAIFAIMFVELEI